MRYRMTISCWQKATTLVLLLAVLTTGAAARDGEVVTVYTSREPAFVEPLLQLFGALTHIKVELVHVKDNLVDKAAAADSRADLLLTTDFTQLIRAKERGLTEPVSLQVLERSIPAAFRDREQHWFGLTKRARVILVSKERVKLDAMAYEDLGDPAWKGRICTRSGRHPYSVGLIASLLAHKGEAWTERWLRGLKGNLVGKPEGGDRDQIAYIHAGKCDVALVNSYYLGAALSGRFGVDQQVAARSVKLIVPNAGDRGAHVSITGMALTSKASNPKGARLLMDFLVSSPAQSVYATDNFEYPIRDDVPASKLLSSWGNLKADALALGELARFDKLALDLVDKVAFDLGVGN